MRIYYVYTHSIDGKVFYVGKGRGNRAYQTRSRNRYWHNMVNKYGHPTIKIVKDKLTDDESYELEKTLIKEYGIDNLVNISEGGTIYGDSYDKSGNNNPMYGKTHSKEAKEKMKTDALTRKNGKYKRSEETLLKLSNSLKEYKVTDVHKHNMSNSQKNMKPQTCPNCGKTGTHNMKRYHFDKCSVLLGKSHKPTWTKGQVIVIDNDMNETMYESMTECAKILKIDVHGISDHIKNGTTYSRGIYKGYKFKNK
jgi:hypothetical protein